MRVEEAFGAQGYYSLLGREAEFETGSFVHENRLGVIVWSHAKQPCPVRGEARHEFLSSHRC